jgi:energy-converting hydrogenase Eha subunit G
MFTKIFSAVVSALLLVTLGGASIVSGAPLTVYSNNFDGIEIFAAGVTGGLSGITGTVGVEGFAGLGSVGNQFSGNLLLNGSGDLARFNVTPTPTTLTLSNLPAHTSRDVNFLLAIIDSWDSTNGLNSAGFFADLD